MFLCIVSGIAFDLRTTPVINDSRAFQYVGKAVEVFGLVIVFFAFPISPLRSAGISFGREYPDRLSSGSFLTPKKA
jgi:hypothetical protein